MMLKTAYHAWLYRVHATADIEAKTAMKLGFPLDDLLLFLVHAKYYEVLLWQILASLKGLFISYNKKIQLVKLLHKCEMS